MITSNTAAVVCPQDLVDAANRMARSTKGRNALNRLLDWLDDDGLSLDGENKAAVMTLLLGAFGSYPGTARDAMRDAVGFRA